MPSFAVAAVVGLPGLPALRAADPATGNARAGSPDTMAGSADQNSGAALNRIKPHPRVRIVFRYAMKQSTAFEDLVAALELGDRTVYIDEGTCRIAQVHDCLKLMDVPGGKHLLLQVPPRQPIKEAAERLAHALYHAAEISRDANAVDEPSIRALFGRIGDGCVMDETGCWETTAAVAFEARVSRELNGAPPSLPSPHRGPESHPGSAGGAETAQIVLPLNRVRFANGRIAEVFRYALRKSTAFQDLIAALELGDRLVHVEEGVCRHHSSQGCLSPMPTPGGKHLLVRIASREPINRVAAQLAHELYHAAEIGREPSAIDEASIRLLYSTIGERSCGAASVDCWETSAAMAFEALVTRQLNGVTRLGSSRHHSGTPD